MLPDIQRTIVALATAPRPAERAIVRLAGPNTRQILGKLCENLPDGFLDQDYLQWCECHCPLPAVQVQLPVTLLYWPNDRSYTGSPAAEIHMLGCVPLAEAVINRCCELGAETAQRGEFTLRAFLAGKLDLAQAEAVLGVIEADSQQTLKAALSQLGGNLAPAIAPLRANLIDVVAELEAGLDFVDEDIQFISSEQVIAQLQTVGRQLDEFASRLDTRSSTDRAPHVVLTGLPNSGKSSLFNAICRQPLAIVADIPGTTRDYLQHRIQLRSETPSVGLNKSMRRSGNRIDAEFDLVDTAGWEELSGATPRAMAQEQLAKCLKQAQLALLCIDMSAPHADVDAWMQLKSSTPNQRWLIVGTKSDLISGHEQELALSMLAKARDIMQTDNTHNADNIVITSSSSVESIEKLSQAIADRLHDTGNDASSLDGHEPLAVVHETAVRCRAALSAARNGIAAALEMAELGGGEELIAAELRLVLHDLSTIIGEVHSDDVLSEIFSRFCIGK